MLRTLESKPGDQKGSKAIILNAMRMHGAMPRIELTEVTGLSRATITTAIAELIEYKLVRETEIRQYTGGRPAINLELTAASSVVLGASLDNQTWTLGAFDLLGNMVKSTTIPIMDSSPEATILALSDNIADFVRLVEANVLPLLGLGTPGLVDTRSGVIQSAANLGWSNVEIGKMMSGKLGWPTAVLNRHRARGLAECRYGSGRKYKQIIYIGVGSGVAAGLFLDRQLLSGAIGGAGEVGHITVDPEGPLCPCGNHGCLQLLCAGPAIEQNARMLLRSGEHSVLRDYPNYDMQLLKADDICRAADQGDGLALKVVTRAASYLGVAMANLVNLFNPEAIILGGEIPRKCDVYVQTADKVMRQRAMGALSAVTEVVTASLIETGEALGAANFALDTHLAFSLFHNAAPSKGNA
jgi:predicted NBD/HSP70 family sugar kinase